MRVSVAIQFTSQVLPPSSENDCSKRPLTSMIYQPDEFLVGTVVESEGKHVVAVIVQPDHNRPHFAGPAFVRVSSESVKASEQVFEDLIATRSSKARQLLEAMRKGELVSVSVWIFGNRSTPQDCKIVECTPWFAVFQPNSGGPIPADFERVRLGRAGDGKQLSVEITHST